MSKNKNKCRKKYYAIIHGRKTGIFNLSWDNVKQYVNKYPDAIYKGFKTENAAKDYFADNATGKELKEALSIIKQESSSSNKSSNKKNSNKSESDKKADVINSNITNAINNLKDNQVIAFTDGSYNSNKKYVGWGNVIFFKDIILNKIQQCGQISKPELIQTRNVIGELVAAAQAINWAVKNHYSEITIYHDYVGVSEWANNHWKAKKEMPIRYQKFIKKRRNDITINFIKVDGHHGITFNDEVDLVY